MHLRAQIDKYNTVSPACGYPQRSSYLGGSFLWRAFVLSDWPGRRWSVAIGMRKGGM